MDRQKPVGNVAAFRLGEQKEPAPSDRELIDRTLNGDENAFALLVERFQRKVFRVANAIVRDEVEADFITQDTFVQAYTHLARFQGRAEFETWLIRIAINRSRDSLRHRRVLAVFSFAGDEDNAGVPEPIDERPGPEREVMAGELRAAIERAERKLSAQQKTIFRLRHYEDYAPDEIAAMLGLRPGTVRAHLFRAVHKIREQLKDWMTPDDEAL